MSLLENVKNYFKKKETSETNTNAPKGVCPNCWGKQDWDGEYYKFIKGEDGNPSKEIYNSFIKDVTRKLGKITIDESSYVCETCKTNFK